MKDKRNPRCSAGEVLRFEDSPYEYIITGELGRGGTSVVYDGYYKNHTGTKRPVRIREIKLKNEGERQQVRDVFDLNNGLFETAGLTNRIVNTYEIHEVENFAYIVTTYQEGVTLDRFEPENLREALGAVRGLAHTLELLHDAGYLYLDVKPENVLVLEGGTDWVQLFDFDSVVRTESLIDKIDCSKKTNKYCRADEIPVSGESGDSMPFRLTPEFAAYEQKIGDVKHIGPWTDVYGVGAVLLYLLCGRVPDVFDSDEDAEYDMSRWQNGGHVYRDGLYSHITELLHRTLARYRSDRYQSMNELVDALDKLYADADETRVYVKSSAFSAAENIIGRNTELDILSTWLDRENSPCIYVTGMGGIGKSTIVRKFIADRRDEMDVIIYLSFADSVAETVCDDGRFYINTVSRQKNEELSDYFQRKMRTLGGYLAEEKKKCLIVIDNYECGYEEELDALIHAGCRLVLVTRDDRVPECCDLLKVEAFADRRDMYELVLRNLLSEHVGEMDPDKTDMYKKLDILIDSVHGHTLMLMLISKQIRRGYMSLDEACKIISQSGFAALDEVEAGCTVDGRFWYGHMTDLVVRLFDVDSLTNVQRELLITLSLFGENGVCACDLADITGHDVLNEANELIDGGWVEQYVCCTDSVEAYRSESLALHPVIAQAVRQMSVGCTSLAAASLRQLAELIGQGSIQMKNNYSRWETYGVTVADNCLKLAGVRTLDEYLMLAARIITSTVIEKEDFILRHGRIVLEQTAGYCKMGRAAVSSENQSKEKPRCVNVIDEELIDIADRMTHIYTDRGELAASEKLLQFLDNWAVIKTPYIKGRVCDVWADYMDSLLDGCFVPENAEEKTLLRRQIKAIDKATQLYEQSDTVSARCRIAADLIAKAAYLIRSADYEHALARLMAKRESVDLLNHAKKLMDEVDDQTTDHQTTESRIQKLNLQNRHAYFMTKSWFYTYIDPDIQKAERNIYSAQKIYENACESELDLINYLMIPAANICLELGNADKCMKWLKRAVKICDKNEELAAFRRKKEELEEIVLDITVELGKIKVIGGSCQ